MTNGALRRWKLIRDIVIVAAAVFMLVHETLAGIPDEKVLAAALLMLGIPAALRLDERIRRNGDR